MVVAPAKEVIRSGLDGFWQQMSWPVMREVGTWPTSCGRSGSMICLSLLASKHH